MENKNYHWLILLVIVFAVIAAWLSFPIFFEWLITKHFHINPDEYGKKFGAVGDTYGSLNTLISSIALCAVAYSTWLQVTSLKETRDANSTQIELAEKSHKEQIKESQYAIFANLYNVLLSQKNESYERLNEKLAPHGLQSLFVYLGDIFNEMIATEWKDFDITNKDHKDIMLDKLFESVGSFTGNERTYNELLSYFYSYRIILNFIKKEEHKIFDTTFFITILSDLMTHNEQEVFLWFCSATGDLRRSVNNSKIFDAYFSEEVIQFIVRNFNKSFFNHGTILKDWNKYLSEQTPT